ncbi:uncharacterized protein [Nicotiana tomentosiformis]|uniref:uncharacterized protein n=1 Tax=Nicotiana tomentosiformis TaxID=4098 RepID=UPI00051BFB9C|nr:uncharacterized protein LOC104090362 [Nicotiana tomentosiformis]XP_009596404.1 uncharacterized protein LOC104092499 [Nicotiana tomentosiformis]
MSNLSKFEFVALDISGKNYLSWVLDAEIHLAAKAPENTIIQVNEVSDQDKAKTMIFLRHHLDEGLKTEYLTLKELFELWSSLKERYDHLKAMILPRARYEWIHLRLQNFKNVSEYNSVVFRITSQFKLCGEIVNDEDLLEKNLSTFHASNMVLQQQYSEKGLKKYSELISCLLVAEQHNTLLMKNHEASPTRSAPFSEVNMVAATQKSERRQNHYRGRGHSRGRGHGHGRGRNNFRHHGGNKQENNKDPQNNPLKVRVNIGHKCGPLNKYDDGEANLTYKDDDFGGLANITHLEAEDFFEDID